MSAPISARMTAAATRPMPGIASRRAAAEAKGLRHRISAPFASAAARLHAIPTWGGRRRGHPRRDRRRHGALPHRRAPVFAGEVRRGINSSAGNTKGDGSTGTVTATWPVPGRGRRGGQQDQHLLGERSRRHRPTARQETRRRRRRPLHPRSSPRASSPTRTPTSPTWVPITSPNTRTQRSKNADSKPWTPVTCAPQPDQRGCRVSSPPFSD